jgi:hypothetical protein
MVDNKISNTLIKQINKDEWISPCLFLGENMEILNAEIFQLAQKILQEKNIPFSYLYRLDDNWEKIKIAEIKNFVTPGHSLPGYPIQIFLIENISRFTIQSWNSCLKFFEEPWKHNIIFLTNNSESWVLETILSRVQTFQLGWTINKAENLYFQSLIWEISQWNNTQALNYFYKTKIEKIEYIEFLKNIIFFAKKHFIFIDKLSEIESDIQGIEQNNVNAKYVIDKYLLTL